MAAGGDDGWAACAVRVVACFLAMMVTTAAWALLMLLLLPWPAQRIRQSNVYGHVTGRMLVRSHSHSPTGPIATILSFHRSFT